MSYTLMHGPTLHAEARYTFFLPHPWLVSAVAIGDLVKLGFEYDPPGEKYGGERMWVEVDAIEGGNYVGRLANEPDEPTTSLKYNDEVRFDRENILDVILADRSRLADIEPDRDRYPALPEEREYWERCLVDECVLYEGIPVEYIYREEPDMGDPDDKYPDSGWRIRGKEGVGDDMDERKPAYVAIGAVLNRDDSWIHFVDQPVGSAYMRNFETNTYERVIRP